jgi:hypothetical protein
MDQFLQELSQLSPGTLAAIVALAGAFGAVVSAILTAVLGKFVVTPFLGARDKQDKEVEWRKHAIELTKLDLDRKLKTRSATDTSPLRPSILDFLANYRDLQELGGKTPTQLYSDIKSKRISAPTLRIIAVSLPDGAAGTVYPSTALTASGGTPPLKWSVAPALPAGVMLDAATGNLGGTPTAASPKTEYTFTVSDGAATPATHSAKLTLEIK